MKIKDVLEKTTNFLRDKKLPSARLDAEILISFGLKLNRIDLYINYDKPLKEVELESLRLLVKRRGQGEPISYITGEKEFFGINFKINRDVLIPRPETEHLVEKALEWFHNKSFDHSLRILDLGSGSGCVGLSIASKIPFSMVTLLDASEKAMTVARGNAAQLNLTERTEFIVRSAEQIEWIEAPRQFSHKLFDIIVSNPPYIDREDPEVESFVRKFEPSMALFAEDKGYFFLKSWSEKYQRFLASEALMAMEIGYRQAEEMYDYLKMLDCFSDVQILQDLAGRDRIAFGVKYG